MGKDKRVKEAVERFKKLYVALHDREPSAELVRRAELEALALLKEGGH